MTSLPAHAFRFNDRGLIKENFAADIVVFDPNKVEDLATFEKPHQYPLGIEWVIVNGEVVCEHGGMTGRLPGKSSLARATSRLIRNSLQFSTLLKGGGGSGYLRSLCRPLPFANVHIIEHPVIQTKLTELRDYTADHRKFRTLLDEIAGLMVYEVTRDWPTMPKPVQTPLGKNHRPRARPPRDARPDPSRGTRNGRRRF